MLTYEGARLYCDGHSIQDLAEHFSTPFFLFSARDIAANYSSLTDAFSSLPSGFSIDYCVKTNYEGAILRLLRRMGAGVMLSCGFEFSLAQEAGFQPERITVHGPCKTDQELETAISAGVPLIHVYTVQELERIAEFAAHHQIVVNISLRLTSPGPWWARGLVGWYARRLGIPWQEACDTFRKASSYSWLRPVGFSVHLGTQITRSRPYLVATKGLIRLAEKLQRDGLAVSQISLGGGWPSNTLQKSGWRCVSEKSVAMKTRSRPDLLSFVARSVAEGFLSQMRRSALTTFPHVRLEPGRSLIGPAGLLVSRIRAVRNRWFFVDTSRNVLPESLMVAHRSILPAAECDAGRRSLCCISGKTLNTMDVLAVAVKLPPLQPGDVVVFLDAGAYSLSRACRYAGDIPDAYLLEVTGEIVQIRKEHEFTDMQSL